MATSQLVRRALLYIPSSSPKMLIKSRGLKVDCAIYDLEDSVVPDQKHNARTALSEFLQTPRPDGIREVAVRINAIDTRHALDDLTAVLKTPSLNTVVVPKVQTAADMTFVTDVIRHLRKDIDGPPLRILPLIETAKGLLNLDEISKASPFTSGLVFAAEDFCLDLSITRTASLTELLYARSAIVTAARAHNLPSAIDLVTTAFKGDDGTKILEDECADGKRLGFNGKQIIHPGQIEAAQQAFSPSEKELEWAVRVVTADERANAMGKAAWTLDGKMVDIPVVSKASAVVAKAELCGMNVLSVKEIWKEQKPE